MVLSNVFSPELIKVGLESEDKDEVFEELVELYVSRHPSASRSSLLAAVREREIKQSTGVKPGIAIPHTKTDQIDTVKGIIGISRSGIDYDSLDGKPVYLIFMLFSSENDSPLHLRTLKRLSAILDDPECYRSLMSQANPGGVYDTLCKYEDILTTSI